MAQAVSKSICGQLSAREEKWCQAYYASGDYNEALVAAGYKYTHEKTVFGLRRKPRIQARLRELAEASLEDLKERRGQLISKLMDIVNSDITEVISCKDLSTLPIEKRRTIKSIKGGKFGQSIEMYNKLQAFDLLARISGLMIEKVDVTSGGSPVSFAPVNITFEVVNSKKDITEESTVEVLDAKTDGSIQSSGTASGA